MARRDWVNTLSLATMALTALAVCIVLFTL